MRRGGFFQEQIFITGLRDMPLMLMSGPAAEPVSVEEARAHLRIDTTNEETLLAAFIVAARIALEAQTRRVFVTQSWRLILDGWPGTSVTLPLAPVSAVTAITMNDEEAPRSVAASHYETVLAGNTPRIAALTPWPHPSRRIGGIHIDFTAGYGAPDAVPQPLKQAILMLTAHWYENREPVGLGEANNDLPLSVAQLIAPYRRVRL
jgi:uncharacterized phiE125 gp8 family phage protein